MKAAALRPSDTLFGRTRASDVWHRMREDILSGVLLPGQRLRFEKLRDLYDVSYATIREALSKLSHERLVIADGQRGFTVTPISIEELLDLTSVRVLVETEALKRSIERGDEEWKASVLGAFHRMDKLGREHVKKSYEWFACHRAFHESLVAACDSRILLEYRSILFDKANRYRRLARVVTTVDVDRSNEHREIMEAVIYRDIEHACDLAARHIRHTTDTIVAAAEGAGLGEPPSTAKASGQSGVPQQLAAVEQKEKQSTRVAVGRRVRPTRGGARSRSRT